MTEPDATAAAEVTAGSATERVDTCRFKTYSGSVYEIEMDGRRIRRLYGEHEPTPHQGGDGEWREYEHLSPIEIGKSVVIVWGVEGMVCSRTITSYVVAFLDPPAEHPEEDAE